MAHESLIERAAQAVASAEALLIGAGAGMGVDSGLPDFRGNEGFWKAYPPYAKLGLSFSALANPEWFRTDPTLAWGFYGHRLNLYRATQPHEGFQILLSWARRMSAGSFIYTSNIDGHFQKAGCDPERIVEVHGSLDWLQCTQRCGIGLFRADAVQVVVDEVTFRAEEPLPACPGCGALARPNVLMFSDGEWDLSRAHEQETRLRAWLRETRKARVVVIECGAGMAIPTVRHLCEHIASTHQGTLIRINVREPMVPSGQIGIDLGALAALRAIDERLSTKRE